MPTEPSSRAGARSPLARPRVPRESAAAASSSVRSISLFGGEVTVDGVFVKGSAQASGSGANGDLSASSLSNLVVLDESVQTGQNVRVRLGNWGYAVTLETAVVRSRSPRFGFRGFVTGLHVVLTADHGGLPKGTEIMVGYAEAAASAPHPKPPPPPPQPSDDGPAKEPVPVLDAAGAARRCDRLRPMSSQNSRQRAMSSRSTARRRRPTASARRERPPGTTVSTSSRRSGRRSSPSRTERSSASAGTTSGATASGFATARATSSTTRTSRRTRRWPGKAPRSRPETSSGSSARPATP